MFEPCSANAQKVVFEHHKGRVRTSAQIGLKGTPDSPPVEVARPGRVRTLCWNEDLYIRGMGGVPKKDRSWCSNGRSEGGAGPLGKHGPLLVDKPDLLPTFFNVSLGA